jgi:hypothetical protein
MPYGGKRVLFKEELKSILALVLIDWSSEQ